MPLGPFYKWEDNNRGLDHKCGTCKTVLSSPRAKKTCLGVHEEVCTRYHKTLFFLGQSHNCDACHKTEEIHDKRHRKIMKLIQCIRKHDSLDVQASALPGKKRKMQRASLADRKPTSGVGEELVKEEAGPWDDFLQGQNFSLGRGDDLGEQGLEEWNDSSTLDEDESGWTERTQAETTCAPKTNKKASKAERKRAKHQQDVETITPKELEELKSALHPGQSVLTEQKRRDASQGLAQNHAIENNIAFSSRTFNYSKFRTHAHEKKSMKDSHAHRSELQDTPEQRKILLDPVLQRLGLDSDLTRITKERKALETKLREAIYDDIVAVTNEQAETMQRMAGYWRYANRRTYNAMVRMNEIWDWATGQKLAEIDEEVDSSDNAESESEATLVGSADHLPLNDELSLTEGGNDDGDVDLLEDLNLMELRELSEVTALKPIFDDAKNSTRSIAVQKGRHLASSWSSLEPPSERVTRKEHDENKGKAPDSFEGQASRHSHSMKSASASKKHLKLQYHKTNTSGVSTSTSKNELIATDQNNRFKGLRIEISAPQEETELTIPKTAFMVPIKRNHPNNPSPCTMVVDNDLKDFPALPTPATIGPVKEKPSFTTEVMKGKVLSIGVAAVRQLEAESKTEGRPGGKKKRCFKALSELGERAAESDCMDGEAKGAAWTTVVRAKRV